MIALCQAASPKLLRCLILLSTCPVYQERITFIMCRMNRKDFTHSNDKFRLNSEKVMSYELSVTGSDLLLLTILLLSSFANI